MATREQVAEPSGRMALLEKALRDIMAVWNRDDGTRMRALGDEMHDLAEEALRPVPKPAPVTKRTKPPAKEIPGSRWEATADDMELALVWDGRRLGGIAVWIDNKSGEVAWWTGEVVTADWRSNTELRSLFNTEDEAKAAVMSAATDVARARAACITEPDAGEGGK